MCHNKKILFSDNSLRDLINFRGDVINDYAVNGFEVVLVAPKTCDFTSQSTNVKYIPVDFKRSGMNPFADLRYMRSLWRIYHRERPDYIFHYTIKPNIYGSIAAWMCGIPSTAMIAGLGYVFTNQSLGSKIARALYRFAMRFPQHVFVLNSYNAEMLLKKKIVSSKQLVLLSGGEGVNLLHFS